jgi:hypothetical protein
MKSAYLLGSGLALCATLGFSTSAMAALSCGSTPNCYVNAAQNPDDPENSLWDAGIFKASWSISGGNTLNVTIESTTTGWVSIGFSQSASMGNTDYIMGGYKASTDSAYAADYLYTSNGPGCPQCAPTLDTLLTPAGTANIDNVSGSESGGVTTFSFSRALNTGDVNGDFDLTQGSYALLWAINSSSDNLAVYHTGGRGILAQDVRFVPVPSAVWLMGSALFGLSGLKRRHLFHIRVS